MASYLKTSEKSRSTSNSHYFLKLVALIIVVGLCLPATPLSAFRQPATENSGFRSELRTALQAHDNSVAFTYEQIRSPVLRALVRSKEGLIHQVLINNYINMIKANEMDIGDKLSNEDAVVALQTLILAVEFSRAENIVSREEQMKWIPALWAVYKNNAKGYFEIQSLIKYSRGKDGAVESDKKKLTRIHEIVQPELDKLKLEDVTNSKSQIFQDMKRIIEFRIYFSFDLSSDDAAVKNLFDYVREYPFHDYVKVHFKTQRDNRLESTTWPVVPYIPEPLEDFAEFPTDIVNFPFMAERQLMDRGILFYLGPPSVNIHKTDVDGTTLEFPAGKAVMWAVDGILGLNIANFGPPGSKILHHTLIKTLGLAAADVHQYRIKDHHRRPRSEMRAAQDSSSTVKAVTYEDIQFPILRALVRSKEGLMHQTMINNYIELIKRKEIPVKKDMSVKDMVLSLQTLILASELFRLRKEITRDELKKWIPAVWDVYRHDVKAFNIIRGMMYSGLTDEVKFKEIREIIRPSLEKQTLEDALNSRNRIIKDIINIIDFRFYFSFDLSSNDAAVKNLFDYVREYPFHDYVRVHFETQRDNWHEATTWPVVPYIPEPLEDFAEFPTDIVNFPFMAERQMMDRGILFYLGPPSVNIHKTEVGGTTLEFPAGKAVIWAVDGILGLNIANFGPPGSKILHHTLIKTLGFAPVDVHRYRIKDHHRRPRSEVRITLNHAEQLAKDVINSASRFRNLPPEELLNFAITLPEISNKEAIKTLSALDKNAGHKVLLFDVELFEDENQLATILELKRIGLPIVIFGMTKDHGLAKSVNQILAENKQPEIPFAETAKQALDYVQLEMRRELAKRSSARSIEPLAFLSSSLHGTLTAEFLKEQLGDDAVKILNRIQFSKFADSFVSRFGLSALAEKLNRQVLERFARSA